MADYSVTYVLILSAAAEAYAASLLTAHRHPKLASQYVSIVLQQAINSKVNFLLRHVLL